jgi:hypothetical protein
VVSHSVFDDRSRALSVARLQQLVCGLVDRPLGVGRGCPLVGDVVAADSETGGDVEFGLDRQLVKLGVTFYHFSHYPYSVIMDL